MLKLINDCISSGRYYIDKGLFEPIHLLENERQFLFDGMQTSIANIAQEVIKSNQICKQTCGSISREQIDEAEEIQKFYREFCSLLNEKPYILQKVSLHGIILFKEIITKARHEANKDCHKNLALEIDKLKK